jgi:hypothetical protein
MYSIYLESPADSVLNGYDEQTGGTLTTGLRVEFFGTSAFN